MGIAAFSGCGSGLAIAGDVVQQQRSYKTDALIYAGVAAAYGGPEALAEIVESHGLTQRTVNSEELDRMTLDELANYGVILWPGGYATEMSDSLRAITRENIRKAVSERGVGFAGYCAGAFIAVSPPAKQGQDGPDWGFALIQGETLPYYHLEDEGVDDAIVKVGLAGGSQRDLIWWGGPYFPEYQHGVIARYADDNKPAIIEQWSGKGLVVLSGPHPEAPDNWRQKLNLTDKDGLDHELAWDMIQAALKQQPMETLN